MSDKVNTKTLLAFLILMFLGGFFAQRKLRQPTKAENIINKIAETAAEVKRDLL
jgi:hypothetical protein